MHICSPRLVQSHSSKPLGRRKCPWQPAMAKPASQHPIRPPSTTASSSSNPSRRRPQHPSAPSPGVLAALAALVGTGTTGALPTERDVPDFLCPSLLASQAQVTTRDNEIEFAQTNTQPTPSTSCSETTTSSTPSSDQAYLQSSSPYHSPAEPWLVRADAALDENSISPRYRRLRRRRAKRASAQENGGGSKIRRDLPEHYARNIPDRYEQGDDGLWHKVEFYASCSRCQVRVTCLAFLTCSWTTAIPFFLFSCHSLVH